MRLELEPIVACITGVQSVPVAIVRVSGVGSVGLMATSFEGLPAEPEPRRLYYGRFHHGDEGFTVVFEPSRSFTGEECCEAMLHGSPASVHALLANLMRAGAREALPGEFTQRAFLHGRIDLTEAEGVRASIEAQTDRQFRLAQALREGRVAQALAAVRERIAALLAGVEAQVDFSEEVGPFDRAAAIAELESVLAALSTLESDAAKVALIQSGLRIVLTGRPNSGKSSLLNALVGHERAITSAIPGTTRDYVEAALDYDGFKVVLIDTAGLHATEDPIELEGIRRAIDVARKADRIWYLFDSSEGWKESDERNIERLGMSVRRVPTKADLVGSTNGISVVTGQGVPDLIEAEVRGLRSEDPLPVQPRHAEGISETAASLVRAKGILEGVRPLDLVSVDLREALDRLGTITGETATDDLLDRIFRDFCIGK